MVRTASAAWSGDLKTGQGHLSTASGVLTDTPYSYRNRFEDEPGTNPEELIGAAHAGCFTMASSLVLANAGFVAEELRTKAEVTLEPVDGNMTVTKIHLTTVGRVPGIDEGKFKEVLAEAKEKCPISRLLNCTITLDASLA
jgi:osmotically inducible protein OsmC